MANKATTLDKNIAKLIASNNKAYYEYEIIEYFEVGIVLKGSEVKSLRETRVNLVDSHAMIENEEIFIHNLHIEEYSQANRFNHYPKRPKKLLMHKRQIRKFIGLFKKKRIALIPLKIYINHKNLVKIILSLAEGKKKYDKRQTIKEREWNRNQAREMTEALLKRR